MSIINATLDRHDYQALAKHAKLRYVSDEQAGFARRRWGRGFTYRDELGNTVKDKALRKRFDALMIPPMWNDVWICPYEDGHLQATGRDEKGRKQYLYHQRWETVRSQAKFDAILGFGAMLPNLREQIEHDLEVQTLSRANVLAAVVKLLETTLIRIGNSRYAKQNQSYGLSTLRSRHVSETDDGLAFDFVGKSAKTHHIELQDERLIAIIRACSDLPGYRIFKYIDEHGDKQLVESQDINEYIRTYTTIKTSTTKARERADNNGLDDTSMNLEIDDSYSAKDFRTWGASVLASSILYEFEHTDKQLQASEPYSSLREQSVIDMVKSVAEHLGNTASVSRGSYIHPKIIEAFLAGEFYEPYKQARRGRRQKYQQVDEKALLGFLSA